MFIFFHVAIPLLLYEITAFKKALNVQRFSLIVGSMLPDILEKPLALMHLASGRGIFHAPFVWLVIWGTLSLVFKKKDVINGVCFGSIIHLMLDLPGISLFWPFVQYNFVYLEDPLLVWLESLLHNPVVITTEIMGILSLLFIIYRNHLWFHINTIRTFLLTPTKILNTSTL